jgi:hypothetical protein
MPTVTSSTSPVVTTPANDAPATDAADDQGGPAPAPSSAPGGDVFVWANEGDPATPGALQPIDRAHFGAAADGSPTLAGPRVNVSMPDRIAVRVHEIRMTDVLADVDNPFSDPTPDASGAFSATAGTAAAGATTAFYAATQVIDDADRWAGHKVAWGDDGRLDVVPYSLVTNFFNSYYHPASRTLALGALGAVDANSDRLAPYTGEVPGWDTDSPGLVIDGAASRDIVAHEAGHAVLYALKPGLAYGVGRAYQEGFADALSALTALGDPDVAKRVLQQTGGDLRKSSEVTQVAEEVGVVNGYMPNHGDDTSAMRSLLEVVKLSDISSGPRDRDVPGMGMVPSRSPHSVGHVFSGAAWDFTAAVFDAEKQVDGDDDAALQRTRDYVGTVLMRASRHLPEHDLTFESVAHAMLRVEREVFGGKHSAALVKAFADREVIPADLDVDAMITTRKSELPDFTLPATVTTQAEILAKLTAYETAALAAIPDGDRGPHPHLLWHNPYMASIVTVDPSKLSLYSDDTDKDGWRVIRLAYDTTGAGGPFTAHISVVLDENGKLADVRSDRPNFPSPF